MKQCSKCNITKPVSEFYPAPQCKFGVRPDCKTCNKKYSVARAREYKKQNKERHRDVLRKHKYGMEPGEFAEMLQSQNNSCKICGTKEPGCKGVFVVDHCHSTGKVRGLLCHKCNVGLGKFEDDVSKLESAIRYLESQ